MQRLFQEDDVSLDEADGKAYLVTDKGRYLLYDHPYEPCLYIKGSDGTNVTIHHSFTVAELRRAAQTKGSIKMVTGNDYDIRGVIKLIRKAIDLSRESQSGEVWIRLSEL